MKKKSTIRIKEMSLIEMGKKSDVNRRREGGRKRRGNGEIRDTEKIRYLTVGKILWLTEYL